MFFKYLMLHPVAFLWAYIPFLCSFSLGVLHYMLLLLLLSFVLTQQEGLQTMHMQNLCSTAGYDPSSLLHDTVPFCMMETIIPV